MILCFLEYLTWGEEEAVLEGDLGKSDALNGLIRRVGDGLLVSDQLLRHVGRVGSIGVVGLVHLLCRVRVHIR